MLPHSRSRAYHQELMSRYVDEAKRDRRARGDGLERLARLAEAIGNGLVSLGRSKRRSYRQRPA